MMIIVILSVVVVTFLASLGFTKAVLLFAYKKSLFDQPNNRTVHTAPVPRLGGVGLSLSFLLGFLTLVVFNLFHPISGLESLLSFPILGVVVVFFIMNIVGLYDDLKPIRAITKFLWQTATALLVIAAGYYLKVFQVPFTDITLDLGPIGPVITYFWIVGISNAINLIDGMDGLAGGISTLAIGALGLFFTLVGLPVEALLSFLLVGALIGFLFFNFPPAKTFMGDSGSLLLGTALAVLPLMGGEKSPFSFSWLIPLILVLIPIADTLGAIWRRLRDGRPIYAPDKEHVHHKLLHLGFSTRQILAIMYSVEIVLVLPLVVTGVTLDTVNMFISFWLPLASGVILALFFVLLHFVYRGKVAKESS